MIDFCAGCGAIVCGCDVGRVTDDQMVPIYSFAFAVDMEEGSALPRLRGRGLMRCNPAGLRRLAVWADGGYAERGPWVVAKLRRVLPTEAEETRNDVLGSCP